MKKFDDFINKSGLSEAEIGAKIGAKQSMVNLLRHGKRKPGPKLVVAIQKLSAGKVRFQDWYK